MFSDNKTKLTTIIDDQLKQIACMQAVILPPTPLAFF